jgi:hypothetical protein
VGALLAALAVGFWQAWGLWEVYAASPRLPLWDMARHGWASVELLRPLERGEVLTFLDRLNRQESWPFGFSLLLLPFLAGGGGGFASATLASTVLFALTPALLVWAGWELERGGARFLGTGAGLFAALMWAASPLPRLFAILVMRETAGAALALLAFALYARALGRETRSAYGAAGIAALALLLVKYNYGLLWLLGVVVHQVLRLDPAGRAALRRLAAERLWPWRSGRRGRIALAAVFYLLTGCALARVNIGYAVYVLLLVGTVALVMAWRRDRAGLMARWRALPAAPAALLATVVLPLWVWFLSPHPIHPKAVFAFLRNRSGDQPALSADALLTYPRALLADFAPSTALGGIVLAGALIGAVLALRRAERAGPLGGLALIALVGFGLTTLHPFKEPRFLFTVAPFVVLLGAAGLARALSPLRRPAWNALVALLLPACGLGLIHWTAPAPARAVRLAAGYTAASSDPALAAVLEVIHRQARPGVRTAFLGGANELSEALVRWWLAEQGNPQSEALVDPPNRFDAGLPPEEIRRRVGRWLADERPERVLALRPTGDSPLLASRDYQSFNSWQLGALASLRAEPDWKIVRKRRFRAQHLEILVLERAP